MTQGKTHREPLLRIAKRDGIARPKAWAIRIIAVLLSLVVSGIFIFAVTKLNPFQVYEGIFDGAFGTPRRSWVTVRDAMMLLCIGVGLAPAFKMRFWNIGAEGQILIGGIVTAGFMRAFGGDISTPLLLVIMAVVSLLAGAAWGMVPATFKAVWNTNQPADQGRLVPGAVRPGIRPECCPGAAADGGDVPVPEIFQAGI